MPQDRYAHERGDTQVPRCGWRQAPWGDYRVTSHVLPATVTHGRGGFFIHGGTAPGSAGRIDLMQPMGRSVTRPFRSGHGAIPMRGLRRIAAARAIVAPLLVPRRGHTDKNSG